MKKKNFIVILILFLAFGFSINVNADGVAIEGKDNTGLLDVLKGVYEKGPQYKTISETSDMVEVYGRSVCDATTNTCDYSYYSLGSNLNNYFSSYIVCSNGASSIGYNLSQAATGASSQYKGSYTGDEDIIVYWQEDYYVTCITDSTSGSSYEGTTQLENSGNSSTGSSSGNVSGDYPSSDTEDNVDTGVFTYYVILALIAAGSYILLIASKKHNFFKKI